MTLLSVWNQASYIIDHNITIVYNLEQVVAWLSGNALVYVEPGYYLDG